MKGRVSALTRRYALDRGWHILNVCQPQHLFRRDIERRHSRVADPRDPWHADIGDEPSFLECSAIKIGHGATADEAVIAAIPSDIRASLRRLEVAVDSLRDCLQK